MGNDVGEKVGEKVILRKDNKFFWELTCYSILYTHNGGKGPVYEGSKFRASDLGCIDGHFFVEQHELTGNGDTRNTIVGVAHSREELESKIYERAKNYCIDLAKKMDDAEFINEAMTLLKKL